MSPTAAISLYISLFTVLFVVILILLIFRQNKIITFLVKEIKNIKEDLSEVKEANKEVVSRIISHDAASRIFPIKYPDEIKAARKARRKEKLQKLDVKIASGLVKTEQFVGLYVLDKLGVLLVLVGLAFLVGLGIEYNWINTIGQVFFGLLIAGVLMLLGYLVRSKFHKVAAALIGGGFAALTFTVFAAYYQYDLIPVFTTYLLVAFVIGLSILVSVVTGDDEVAVLTFVAGFLAPLSVHIVSEDYRILFTYVLLLDIGVLIFEYFRKNLFVNLMTFAFTYLIYGLWLIEKFLKMNDQVPFGGAFLFLTIFYILIFIVVLLNNIKEGRKFIGLEFSAIISSTATYYTAGYIIINRVGADYQGIFTLWIAVVTYAFFLILYPRKGYDRRVLNLLLALSLMFFALVIPVQYMGKSPTLVWALQAILLMFISIKADFNGMKLGSLELTVLMIGSLAFDIYEQYVGTVELEVVQPFFNKTFLSSMLAVFSVFANAYLLKFEKRDYFGLKFIPKKYYQLFLVIVGSVMFYISLRFEIIYSAIQIYNDQAIIKVYLSLLNYTLLAIPAIIVFFVRKKPLYIATITSFVIAYLLYIFVYARSWGDLRDEYLLSPYVNAGLYNLHYFAALLLFVISIAGIWTLTKLYERSSSLSYLTMFVFVGFILAFVSNELANAIVIRQYQPHLLIQAMLQKIKSLDYSILWGLMALLFVILGVWFKNSELRASGALLYLITLIKSVAYDYFRLNNEELIALFTVLGLVMILGAVFFHLQSKISHNAKAQVAETSS